jgi:SpoIID/LytB domain protein
MATVDDKKIIFSMVGLNKTIQQNNKQVLKNIYLSFFYGAKIGIIGLNGSGKSTLLKIIAGWGHGAGLCQIGAAVMGEQGYKYDEILLHYYIGASIDQLYD